MNRVTGANCPHCGAQLQPVPGSEQATCAYCGTVSFVQRARAAAPATAAKSGASPLVFVALGVGALVVLGIALGVLLLVRSGDRFATAATPTQTAASGPAALGPTVGPGDLGPAKLPEIKVVDSFNPLLGDIDGDGSDDVVSLISAEGSPATEHYAAFSGRTAHEISRTPVIADRNDTVAIVGRRLLSASRSGQLTSFGLATGAQQWTTALGARVVAFCTAKTGDSVIVATDEQRQLSIDLTTGRQSETKAPCTSALVRNDNDPRDRHDYRAPFGVESYHCGGVTVMGSQNYTVLDQCLVRAHVDTDRLDGLNGSRLWKVDQNWVVFGVRKPGTRVPMVGLVSHGKLTWKSEIPRDNPLEAQEGSPQYVGLAGPTVVAAYVAGKVRKNFITAFNVADGARRWTVPLEGVSRSVSALAASADRAFVQAGDALFVVSVADGKVVGLIGK